MKLFFRLEIHVGRFTGYAKADNPMIMQIHAINFMLYNINVSEYFLKKSTHQINYALKRSIKSWLSSGLDFITLHNLTLPLMRVRMRVEYYSCICRQPFLHALKLNKRKESE